MPVAGDNFVLLAVSDRLAVVDPPLADLRAMLTPVILMKVIVQHGSAEVVPEVVSVAVMSVVVSVVVVWLCWEVRFDCYAGFCGEVWLGVGARLVVEVWLGRKTGLCVARWFERRLE